MYFFGQQKSNLWKLSELLMVSSNFCPFHLSGLVIKSSAYPHVTKLLSTKYILYLKTPFQSSKTRETKKKWESHWWSNSPSFPPSITSFIVLKVKFSCECNKTQNQLNRYIKKFASQSPRKIQLNVFDWQVDSLLEELAGVTKEEDQQNILTKIAKK